MSWGKPFEKGNPGKKKGTQNALTVTLRVVFEKTFQQLQAHPLRRDRDGNLLAGEEGKQPVALYDWARANPGEFYKLAARLIPQQISGPGGGPIPIGVSGQVTLYLPENTRALPPRGNGGGD